MKRQVYELSAALGLFRGAEFFHRRQPLVLAFHGVTDESPGSLYNHEGAHLHRPVFHRLLELLSRRHTFVSMEHVAQWVRGEVEVPDRAVAITFDDGYRNVSTQAASVLQEFGAPATLYTVTDFVFDGHMLWPDRLISVLGLTRWASVDLPGDGAVITLPLRGDVERAAANARMRAIAKSLADGARREFLAEVERRLEVDESDIRRAWPDFEPLRREELRGLHEKGITVGSHTCSHPIVARCDERGMDEELRRSRRLLEEATGRECRAFAYPNGAVGDFNDVTRNAVASAGYTSAATTVKRRVSRGDDVYEIPRCILTHNRIRDAEFMAEVSGYAGVLRRLRGRGT